MKIKYTKVIGFILILLFSILSLTGCFFGKQTNAISNDSLEIDYFLEKGVEDKEISKSNSLLSQVREKMQLGNGEEIETEEVEEIQSERSELSFWEKLKQKNRDRASEEDSVETLNKKVLEPEDEIKKVVKKNTFLEDYKKLKEENKQDKEKQEEENKKDGKKRDKNKDRDIEKDKEKEYVDEKAKENTVTITIRCDTAVAKDMHKDPKFVGIVPSSGVILSSTTVKIKEGDTVLSVLETITDKYKVQMRYTGTKESAYIEGINNLYEFDGGRWSGWMYCVNGWYPNYGAGVYALQGGNVIEWNYTCDLGKDLGQEWLGN